MVRNDWGKNSGPSRTSAQAPGGHSDASDEDDLTSTTEASHAVSQKNQGEEDWQNSSVTIYTPESSLRRPAIFIKAMWRDLLVSRELAWRLFLRDTRARYRNSLLGYLWVFIPPIFAALPFIFLNSQGVIKIAETPLPYAAFAMIGTMIWQVFADALNSPIQEVSGGRHMLTRINFPREAVLLSGLLQVAFSFVVRLALLVLVLAVYGIVPPPTALLFPVGILALVLSGFAFGLLLTPLGLLYGDVQRVIGIMLPFLMLLTPVLYPPPQSGLAGTLVSLNPLAPLINNTRDWLTVGTTSDLGGFIAISVLMIVLLTLGWIGYRVAMPHLIPRLGN